MLSLLSSSERTIERNSEKEEAHLPRAGDEEKFLFNETLLLSLSIASSVDKKCVFEPIGKNS